MTRSYRGIQQADNIIFHALLARPHCVASPIPRYPAKAYTRQLEGTGDLAGLAGKALPTTGAPGGLGYSQVQNGACCFVAGECSVQKHVDPVQ